jgi:hypothetical protein
MPGTDELGRAFGHPPPVCCQTGRMDLDKGVRRRLIAMLTAAISDMREGSGDTPLLDLLAADARDPRSRNLALSAPINAQTISGLIDAALADDRRYTWSAALFASQLFLDLAADVTRDHPDFDVDAFLRRAALQLESDDEIED